MVCFFVLVIGFDNIIKSNIKGDYIIKVADKPNIEGIIDLVCNEIILINNFKENI